jgi:hypothetical protein
MKNIDYVIQKTASELQLPVDQARMVIMEYWKTATSRLVNLEATTVSMRHIGNFTVSRYKLNKYIRKRILRIRNTMKNNVTEPVKKQEILDFHYSKLRKALVQRNILAKHYVKIFKKDEQD